MPTKSMPFDIPEGFEQTAQRFIDFLNELYVAANTPERDALDLCEGIVLTHERDAQQESVRQALQQRIDTAEKKASLRRYP